MLWLNRWSCPPTGVAARYFDDRRVNCDIYLPEWLGRYSKQIFGLLYIIGVAYAVARSRGSPIPWRKRCAASLLALVRYDRLRAEHRIQDVFGEVPPWRSQRWEPALR